MCLDRTRVLVQPEGVRVLVVELLPNCPVAPLRATVLTFRADRVVMWLIWQHLFGQGYVRTRPASLNPTGVM